jgi:ribonuclease P protein component
LFSRNGEKQSVIAFPLRAVWRKSDLPTGSTKFLISVPKKRLKHAVDRVTMRRRVREAYRLNRDHLNLPSEHPVDIAFVYVSDTLQPYERVEKAVRKILDKVSESDVKATKTDSCNTADTAD